MGEPIPAEKRLGRGVWGGGGWGVEKTVRNGGERETTCVKEESRENANKSEGAWILMLPSSCQRLRPFLGKPRNTAQGCCWGGVVVVLDLPKNSFPEDGVDSEEDALRISGAHSVGRRDGGTLQGLHLDVLRHL